MTKTPSTIRDEDELDDLLAQPTDSLVDVFRRRTGDVIILGCGGKVGPGLARLAVRASRAAGHPRSVTAVSRFSDPTVRHKLHGWGVETHVADLFNPKQVTELPAAELIVFLVGRKFGTRQDPCLTWATNVSLPTMICQRYPGKTMVALSTLCVYPFVTPDSGGSRETDAAEPRGEYAFSTLGRERVFDHFSRAHQSPTALIRLTYSVELRYGVLFDIGQRVWDGRPVDLSMEYVNVLWQGDVNARLLTALDAAEVPARPLNVAGPGFSRVADLAHEFAQRFGKPVQFCGAPAGDAWLPATSQVPALAEPPRVSLDRLIDWTADWIQRGQASYGKPTHFEVRDGCF